MRFDKDQRPAKYYLLLLAGTALLLMLYTVGGFWVLPAVVKPLLEKNLSAAFHRSVSIEKVTINPYELAFSVKGFVVRDQNSTDNFLAFDELYAVIQGGSLLERAPIIRELTLSEPYVNISRKKDGTFNFSDFFASPGSRAKPPSDQIPEPASQPDSNPSSKTSGAVSGKPQAFRFSIHNIRIMNGTVEYQDENKGEKERIANLGLELPLVSSLGETPDGEVDLTVWAKINESPLSVIARGKPFIAHPEWAVDVELQGLNFVDYLAYLPPRIGVKVRSGLLDAKAGLTYAETDNGTALKISGEANLSDFKAVDRNDRDLIELPQVNVGLASFEPLAGKLHLSRILIQSPDMTLWRHKDGTLNLQKLISPGDTETKRQDDNGSQQKPGLEVTIDAIQIAEGRIEVTDHAVEPAFHTSLERLELSLSGLTNTPGSQAVLKLDARTGDNETVGLEGSLSPDPLSWKGRGSVSDLVLAKYAPYYQRHILFEVVDGRLTVASSVQVDATGKQMRLDVSDLVSSLASLKLKKPDEPENYFEVPDLQVRGGALKLADRSVVIGELSSRAARLTVVRKNTGELNLQRLTPVVSELVDGSAVEPATTGATPAPWKVLLQTLSLKDYTIRFEDRMMAEPVTLLVDQVSLEGRGFSTDEEAKPHLALSCRVNEGGTAQVEGDIKTSPLFADLKLTLQALEIPPVQPYLPRDIKVKMTSGKLSAAGKLLLAVPKEGDFNTSYVGDVSLADFASVDSIAGEDLLKWKGLDIKGLDAGNNPTRAGIKRIDWREFFARIAISAEGKINVLQLLGSETGIRSEAAGEPEKVPKTADKPPRQRTGAPGKQAGTPPQAPPVTPSENKADQLPAVTIDQIALQGGTIAFSDNLIKPNVHAQMLDVGGTITGLSSKKDTLADVNLRGKLYRTSPLQITGKLRPFPDNLFADLNVTFKDIDMSRWDPYARKYVGYTLEKGNLQLELKYLLAKTKLDAQNSIVLDRLTLGDKVDSPEATTLPVKFAISLLQDRNGQIELGIPVTGDLGDPKFSLGNTLLTFFKNLIMKAITAPFALLGSLLPQGVGEMDRVEIDPATGNIPETGVKKLEALAKVLKDRPNLELDLTGCVESESGKEMLRQQQFQNKLKAQKLKEQMKGGGASVALDQVALAPDEFEKYLKMAYDEEFPKQGLDRLRIFKKTPSEEMKAKLLSTIQATDDDVRAMAYEWALKVKEYLQESGRIEPRRLFLLEPVVIGPTDQAKAKGNGVEMKLK